MCKRRATLFTFIAVFSFSIVLILGIALGSEYWSEATLIRDIAKLNSTGTLPLLGYIGSNPVDGSDPGALRGLMNFGLFTGCKRFNYGQGVRAPTCFSVFTEHEDVYNLSLVITTIVFILGAIVFGLVATVFGLVNTLTVPIETIHGPMGLFVWNGIGGIMSTGAWIVYLILFQTELKENVLNEKDTDLVYNYRTEDVYLGYSFWFLVSANVLLFSNIAMAYLAKKTQDPDFLWRRRRSHDFAENQNKEEVAVAVMY